MMELFRRMLFLPEGVATWSDSVDALHAWIVLTSIAGCFLIFGYTAWGLIFWRTRPPFRPTPFIEAPLWLEIGTVGSILGLFLLWWVLGFRLFVRMVDPPSETLDIQVIGKQWMWEFVYPDGTSSVGVLIVPVDRPVRLVMTSRDVIHSFFVPVLRTKKDVVPGLATGLWFEARQAGTFPIWCAEYCGVDHSRMHASLVVLDPQAYAAWARQRGPIDVGLPQASLADRGREIAAVRGCLRCHTVDGTPYTGPTWVGLYGSRVRLSDGSEVVADEAYLTESMMDPLVRMVEGYPPLMPTYRGQLDVEEIAALVHYIRLLRDGPDPEGAR